MDFATFFQRKQMGYSYESDDTPFMCFNSAKSWQLGWYADKSLTVTPLANGQYEYFVRLASIVDYPTTSSAVLIKVQQSRSPWAFYLNYNAAKGMNRLTQEGKDQVLVTMKNTVNDENLSMLTKLMDPGDILELKNFNGKDGETLTIQFASLTNGEADIAIVLRGPSVPSPTLNPTDYPAPAPTMKPTMSPTSTPSIDTLLSSMPLPSQDPSQKPSQNPTTTPTRKYSVSPTASPTLISSDPPTTKPSVSPTDYPTFVPSVPPTAMPTTPSPTVEPGKPTQQPSSMPSSIPTISPSMSPSDQPSKIPTQSPTFHYSVMTSQTASITPTNVPSLGPMYPTVKATRRAGARLEVANASKEIMQLLCDGVAMYIDDIMYDTYGQGATTNVTCSTDVSAVVGQEQLMITAQTSFAKESFAPIQKDFELYFKDLMSDEETAQELPLYVLRAGLAGNRTFDGDTAAVSFAEVQHSSDPPVIFLSFGDNDNGTPSVPKPMVAKVEMTSGVQHSSELWLLPFLLLHTALLPFFYWTAIY
eukprot:scaffold24655_cov147-Cylindrotheca_fusiformis.AAC.2